MNYLLYNIKIKKVKITLVKLKKKNNNNFKKKKKNFFSNFLGHSLLK